MDEKAMMRRMAGKHGDKSHEHKMIIEIALKALDHPDTPPHVAAMAAPILLGIKHFGGPHPEIDKHMNKEHKNG